MDKKYLNILDKVKLLKKAAEDAADCGACEVMEDKIAFKVMEKLADNLNDAESILTHYSKPAKEGTLFKNENERYFLKLYSNGETIELTCGDRLEAYLKADEENDIDEGWAAGTVEHGPLPNGERGYIFIIPYRASYPLYTGMKARLRG